MESPRVIRGRRPPGKQSKNNFTSPFEENDGIGLSDTFKLPVSIPFQNALRVGSHNELG